MAVQLTPVYQLESAVGKGSPNKASDVKVVEGLVELAMRRFSFQTVVTSAKAKGLPAPDAPLTLTGQYSDNLQKWISFAQAMFKQYHLIGNADGRIDPLPQKASTIDFDGLTKSGKKFTLMQLNICALEQSPEEFMGLRKREGITFWAHIGDVDYKF